MSRLRSIATPLFATLMLTTLGAVVMLVVLFRLSLGAGFNDYLARLELTRLDPFETGLISRYRQYGNWTFVNSPRDLLPPGSVNQRPPPRDDTAPPPFGNDPPLPRDNRRPPHMAFAQRLALFNDHGDLVMGPPEARNRPQRPLILDGQVIGYLALASAPDPNDALGSRFFASQTRNLLLSALFAVLVSALAAVLLARHFRQPIAALAQAARRLAAGQLNARVTLERNDELGDLARDFNLMAQKLERFEQSRRQWVADTSHELRTPLTILRAHTDAMRDGVMPLDQRGLGRIDSAVADLDRLIDDLYQLARADVGSDSYMKAPMSVSALFDELGERFREPMRKAKLTLNLILPTQDLHIEGDHSKLTQLFSNLLSNSMRYTDAGGEVRLSARANGPLAEIQLDDSAPGVPDAALSHLFERFFRVDASRSRQGGGSGLGLSICQAIVAGHDGQIRAQHSQLGGLSMLVVLPLAKPRGRRA